MSSTLTEEAELTYLKKNVTTADVNDNEEEELRPLQIIWKNIFTFSTAHILALIGLYQFLFIAKWETCIWAFILHYLGAFGVTAGAHRLWSHRAYKATTLARVILMLANCLAYQNDIINWARDHRCHHKWTDTESDPHNSKRGFFYSHVGWLLTRKGDKLKQAGATVDISDLYADPVLVFQRRHYASLVLILCFLLPTAVPVYFWNEKVSVAFLVAGIFRYIFTLNSTFLINSAAHMFGYKPYDTSITPVESIWTNLQVAGEGGHNYHHTFPQDYRTSEFSVVTNWTRGVIEAMAWMGLAYDLKITSQDTIERQKLNKGDPHCY